MTSPDEDGGVADDVRIPFDGGELEGRLTLPSGALGIVVFAHGSGSSRHSPRNRAVADSLHRSALGTLLLDLLTDDEAADRARVFDIDLLAKRLVAATTWLGRDPDVGGLPVGYFGASTGAAAALSAAAALPDLSAVVSRGGRPDLAVASLASVRCPTLLIVGGADLEVLRLNELAAAQLRCEHETQVVPGATHLFEEPGTLDAVARLAEAWFVDAFTNDTPRVGG